MSQQWRPRRSVLSSHGRADEHERQRQEEVPGTHVFDSPSALRPLRVSPFRAPSAFPVCAYTPPHGSGDGTFTGASRGPNPIDWGRQPAPKSASITHGGASFRLRRYAGAHAMSTNPTLIWSANEAGAPNEPSTTSVGSLSARPTATPSPRGRFSGNSHGGAVGARGDSPALEHLRLADRGGRRDRDNRRSGRMTDNTASTAFAALDSSSECDTGSPPVAAAVTISQPRVRRLRTQRRREQCRVNQARYRQRQNLRLQLLEELTACMREEIHSLSAMHSASLQGLDRVNISIKTVYEYCNLFRSGLSGANLHVPVFRSTPPATGEDTIIFSAGAMKDRKNDTLMRQAAYLRTIIAPDADVAGALRGPDAVLEQWWRYTIFHKHVFFDVLDVEPLPDHDDDEGCVRLMVTARLCVVPNHYTLTHVFPDLQHTSLGEKLLNQPLEFAVRMGLDFAPVGAHGALQIVRMDADVDLASDLVRTLEYVDDVESVLRGARISPVGIIGSVVDHPSGNRLIDTMASL